MATGVQAYKDSATSAKSGAAAVARTRLHLAYMDSFRGIAILGVIFGHCYYLAFGTRYGEPSATDFVLNIVEGCTVLFVFISGFLFHHVFYAGFDYARFMVSKAKTVFLPFAVVTFVLVAYGAVSGSAPAFVLAHHSLGVVNDFLNIYLSALITGGAGPSLWYVPFIMLVFLLSPLFIRFIEAPNRWKVTILLGALLVGILINRSHYNHDKLQNALYFTFFYLFGICASVHRHHLERWLANRMLVLGLWGGAVALAALQSAYLFNGGFYGDFFEWKGVNTDYVQKTLLILALWGAFIGFRLFNGSLLNGLARDSFALFFVHNLVLAVLADTVGLAPFHTGVKLLDLVIWGVIVTLASQAIVTVIKRCTGGYSRMVIGA